MAKLNFFRRHYFSLQCHIILQKSLLFVELMHKNHFLLLSIVKTVVLLNIFLESMIFFMIF